MRINAVSSRAWNWLERVLLLVLIAFCVLWEGWLAPLRPGGSTLTLKALPLLFAVPGVLRAQRYTSQWLSMAVLLYFIEGAWRSYDPGIMGMFARAEIALSVLLFIAAVGHAHSFRR